MAAGEIKPLPPTLAKEAHDWTLTPRRSDANFQYYARKALRSHPDAITTS
jgi:L-fuculose-phosphate aldolase